MNNIDTNGQAAVAVLRIAAKAKANGQTAEQALRTGQAAVKPTAIAYTLAVAMYQKGGRDFEAALTAIED